jgi:hypothetical protein
MRISKAQNRTNSEVVVTPLPKLRNVLAEVVSFEEDGMDKEIEAVEAGAL